ncbi:hypothetical protein ACRQ5Q_08705 [Bradyrhizobium sp. PMVTL-01]|uniref:hypothetical protein n=1 Tax=Bradyrhizobium sp. PMVTL-01 TaxID=3434999 RepID=UPI003F710C1B
MRGQGLDRWIWRIGRIDGGLMPNTTTLEAHGIKAATLVQYYGGARTMAQYFHVTTDTLVPFFLAIAIQTAANPEPLRYIRRDCLVPHPLDEHRVIVDWNKPKTGTRLQKAQRRSFDRRRRYAAPNLIEMMLVLTEPIVATAPPSEQDRLFLTRSSFEMHSRRSLRGRTGVIEHTVLRLAILRFIKRANQRIEAWNTTHPDQLREPIADFAPALFRGSVATEHYRASGGDILVAQSILNHAGVLTTETYLKSEETTRFQRQTIARLQDLMIDWVSGPDRNERAPISCDTRAAVPFGHDCLAPVAPGRDGTERLCPRFGLAGAPRAQPRTDRKRASRPSEPCSRQHAYRRVRAHPVRSFVNRGISWPSHQLQIHMTGAWWRPPRSCMPRSIACSEKASNA